MERTRTFQWQDPMQGAKQALQMSGIEYLHAMINGELPPPPIMHTLDFNAVRFEKGDCVFAFQPQEFHYNPIGCVHGGVISTLLDSAMGCTIQSLLPQGSGYTTLELKINFLKVVTIKTGTLQAVGKVIHAGSRTALVEAQLVDESGTIYAHGVSTCMILKI